MVVLQFDLVVVVLLVVLTFATVFFRGLDRAFEVTDVVQSIEDTDDVDAVFDGFLDEFLDDVIGVMTITEDVLASEKHLQFRVFADFFGQTKPFPRIFVEETEAGIERRAAPNFQGVVTDLVEFFQGEEDFLRRHAGGEKRLVSIPKCSFNDFDTHGDYFPSVSASLTTF